MHALLAGARARTCVRACVRNTPPITKLGRIAAFSCCTTAQLTHPNLRKQPGGQLQCPKYEQYGVLEGSGMRQGTRTVLCLDTQYRVFSWSMTHKCCPKHNGGAVA